MSDRKQFRDLATPAEAHEAIASLNLDPEPETVPLAEARGRILAERVDAELDVPGFDRASMDGYAVRAADTFGADEANPATLTDVGTVHAGSEPDVFVDDGECAEISTGAVLPDGADAVVMIEKTDEVADSDAVEIRTSLAPGDHVMPAGADIAAGQRALGPGTELTPREIGLLSALGKDELRVRGKPTVGIVSTGDELVRPGEELNSDAGQIYDVNSYTIAAGVEEAGGVAKLYPHAGDSMAAMEETLTTAADECDLVLSSGSTSASAVDVVYKVIEERGELLLHGVSVKPGKPMLIGRLEESAYVGLPGYPVSALTIFRTFVAPAIRGAAGVPEPRTATVEGTLAQEERYSEGRTRMMPVGLVEDESGETLVYPVDKGSGATTSLVEADGVVEVDADTEYLAAGESVTVTLFSPSVRTPALLALGEEDPAFARLLDRLRSSRFLPVGSREGLRRLRDGLPDVAVVAGPTRREVDSVELGSWEREWGLLVPEGNPDAIDGFGDLVDADLRLVNMDSQTGLRASVDAELDRLAAARDVDAREFQGRIDGYEFTLKAHESPARRVLSGKADAGVGLRATAERLGLTFVPVGTQTVRVRANPNRVEKAGVADLKAVLTAIEDVLTVLPGYSA
ncbi:molybdopterin biosynthesis protein [Halolamina sp.]|jgi:putative molybdopterin biosynthesis protein|uniref:molybdopterin biosynthesis protein n=1 Tax=Halolamina sp. TaxID=1940283 RepID=UPI000223C00E|nr:molybdenum cofactor synthesis domain protein [halophilic archaeon DL31]